ncbi:MAG TPA: hypothetical protein VHR41_06680 [Gemmatimonadales bacterium]|nr:hypothetical protein [Gemmatimonadales bacterium]
MIPSLVSSVPPRSGRSPLELAAIRRVRDDVAAFPASLVVSLLLWPETIADWARAQQVTPPLVHNALAGRKPFVRVRQALAERLDVPTTVLSALIETRCPVPRTVRPPVPPVALESGAAARDQGWTWHPAAGERPQRRDGSNPLERKVIYRVALDIATLPASLVVQLILHPTTLAAWCRMQAFPPSVVYALLAGTQRAARVEAALARGLRVEPAVLRALIDAPLGLPLPPAPPDPEPVPERPLRRSVPRQPSPLQLRLDLDQK